MENGLLMSQWIGLRIEHRMHPGASATEAHAVAQSLEASCFAPLSRVAMGVKDREKRHAAKAAELTTEYLLDPSCDDVLLDSGRSGELVASARIPSGRHTKSYDNPNALIGSFVVVPVLGTTAELIDGIVGLVAALHGVAGFVVAERTFDLAHRAVHGKPPRRDDAPAYPERRSRERIAYTWFGKHVDTQVAGPDWGLVLGPGHLARLQPTLATFPVIRDAGMSKVVFVSTEIRDDMDNSFDAARTALAPLLMDVSKVPVD